MITRFDCHGLRNMAIVLLLHLRIKRDAYRQAEGLVAVLMHRDWRRRVVYSVTLWHDLDSVYSMGGVPRHVRAARLPHRLGITTRCGAFSYVGDWRRVMFGADAPAASPLERWHASESSIPSREESACPSPTTAA
jgi:hypothetical protein